MGKFLKWIFIWLFLSTILGFKRKDFWLSKDINLYEGATYRLHYCMAGQFFEHILWYISYTQREPLLFKEKLYEVREIVMKWVGHM